MRRAKALFESTRYKFTPLSRIANRDMFCISWPRSVINLETHRSQITRPRVPNTVTSRGTAGSPDAFSRRFG
jgi:hypothetical protein